jgi:hypothetical protein
MEPPATLCPVRGHGESDGDSAHNRAAILAPQHNRWSAVGIRHETLLMWKVLVLLLAIVLCSCQKSMPPFKSFDSPAYQVKFPSSPMPELVAQNLEMEGKTRVLQGQIVNESSETSFGVVFYQTPIGVSFDIKKTYDLAEEGILKSSKATRIKSEDILQGGKLPARKLQARSDNGKTILDVRIVAVNPVGILPDRATSTLFEAAVSHPADYPAERLQEFFDSFHVPGEQQ